MKTHMFTLAFFSSLIGLLAWNGHASAFWLLPLIVWKWSVVIGKGDWQVKRIWWNDLRENLRERLRAKEQTVLLGAHWPNAQGNKIYVNGMVEIGTSDGKPEGKLITQRVPLPLSMWRPWSDDGAAAFWFGPSSTKIAGKKIGHLICYEQILVWPVLMTFADSPEIVIAPSNLWWAKQTCIPAIQRATVQAWAKLFAVEVITVTNI